MEKRVFKRIMRSWREVSGWDFELKGRRQQRAMTERVSGRGSKDEVRIQQKRFEEGIEMLERVQKTGL